MDSERVNKAMGSPPEYDGSNTLSTDKMTHCLAGGKLALVSRQSIAEAGQSYSGEFLSKRKQHPCGATRAS